MVPVVLAGVGVLITAARNRVLKEDGERLKKQIREGGTKESAGDIFTLITHTAYGVSLSLLHVTGLIVLPENTENIL